MDKFAFIMQLIVTIVAISLLGSLFAGALFYLLKFLHKKLGNKLFIVLTSTIILGICSLLVPWEALGLLIFFIALGTVYYLTRQRDIIMTLAWLTVYFAIVQLILTTISIMNDSCSESRQMIKCASNLKQIGTALFMYAEDNNGHFPDKDGDAGLDMLRQQDYLTDYDVYICPSTSDSAPTSGPVKSSYIYHGGLTFNPAEKNIVIEDKPGNHQGYRNRLHCDTTVNGYSDPNYRKTVAVQKSVIKRIFSFFGWR